MLTELRQDQNYVLYYHLVTWTTFTGLLPFLLLAGLNCSISRAVERLGRQAARRGSRAASRARWAGHPCLG